MGKLVLLAILAFILIAAVVSQQGKQYKSFAEKAGKTAGKITALTKRTFRPNQQTGAENWVQYSYSVEGTSYAGEEKIEYADLWHSLKEGQSIDLYYDKAHPATSHPVAIIDKRIGIADHMVSQ